MGQLEKGKGCYLLGKTDWIVVWLAYEVEWMGGGFENVGPNLVPEDEGDRPPERLFESLSVEGVQLDFLALKMLLVRCLLGERHCSWRDIECVVRE